MKKQEMQQLQTLTERSKKIMNLNDEVFKNVDDVCTRHNNLYDRIEPNLKVPINREDPLIIQAIKLKEKLRSIKNKMPQLELASVSFNTNLDILIKGLQFDYLNPNNLENLMKESETLLNDLSSINAEIKKYSQLINAAEKEMSKNIN